jgi:tetratricopeptide (TPR) repeat protein
MANKAPAYQLMGQLKLTMKDYPKGIELLQKSLELNPEAGAPYFLIASAYAAQGKLDAAIDEYQKMIVKRPKDVTPLMVLGIIYDKKKQTEKANEYYQKVLDINKSFAPAANNLAWNYANKGGNIDVALGIAQRAREASPGDAAVADTLGWIYYKKGSYLNAINLLKESTEKFNDKNPEVLYHLGMAYLKNGERALASQALSKAVSFEQEFNGKDEVKNVLSRLKS